MNQNTTLPNLTVSGTLGGTASVTISGSLTLDGTIGGPGTVTVASAGSLDVSESSFVRGGSLVNDGSGTIAANASLYVFAGASFLNAGSLGLNDDSGLYGEAGTPSSESESGTTPAVAAAVLTNTGSITVTSATSYPASIGCSGFCGAGINDKGTITVSSGELELGGSTLTTDTVDTGTVLYSPSTVDSGATLSVPSGSSLVVIGVVVIDSGGSLSAPGSVTVNGTLTVNQNTTLPNLTVSGVLELGNEVVVHTGSLSELSSLQIDANAPGEFGELDTSGSISLASSGLLLNPSFTPSCGTSVTALTAPSISAGFGFASGPVPSGGTWETSSSSTTAGAYIYCPPPPESAPETYGDGASVDVENDSGYAANRSTLGPGPTPRPRPTPSWPASGSPSISPGPTPRRTPPAGRSESVGPTR